MCMYVTRINENMGYEFEREQRGYLGGFAGKKERKKWCNYDIINKIKEEKDHTRQKL